MTNQLAHGLLLSLAIATPAFAAPQYLGKGSLPGNTPDGLSAAPPVLEDGTPHNQAGGWGSALSYTGVGTYYLAGPDRGPADGATSVVDRYYLMDIRVAPGGPQVVSISVASAALLTNEVGVNLTGNAAAFDATNSPASLRFDVEAVRLGSRGTFFASDEYGPFVYELDATGTRRRALAVPPKFLIANPSANGTTELTANTSGRQSNRGMEGLAISPDGTKLFGLMQNALLQDNALDPATGGRVGMSCRILEMDLRTGATRELVYLLDHRRNGLNEIIAINDHEFLVIERDGNAGPTSTAKIIYRIDTAGASDVSDIASLPRTGMPLGRTPVTKTPFINMLDGSVPLAEVPEKIEGLAFGPRLPDGRLLLLVSSDNDFVTTQPSLVFAYAISAGDLPGYAPQILGPEVDVRPDDAQNTINADGNATVPVSILGNGFLPASAIDRTRIRAAGAPPLACMTVDSNDDGYSDLLCLFRAREMSLTPGMTSIEVIGQTTTGTPLRSSASVTVVGN